MTGDLNLLLSLQGASDLFAMRDFIGVRDRGERDRPLPIISHFTKIQRLTDRNVFERHHPLLDPVQENKVVGQLKLQSAGPDVEYFE